MKIVRLSPRLFVILGAVIACTPAEAPPPSNPEPLLPPAAVQTAAPAESVATLSSPPPPTCAEARTTEICATECEAGNAESCDEVALSTLAMTEEGVLQLMTVDALLAYRKACTLRGEAVCTRADALLDELRARCKQTPFACARLGAALRAVDLKDEADVSLERGCKAGDREACSARGEMHADLEPVKVHGPIAEKSFERACSLDDPHSCCSLVARYARQGREAEANRAQERFAASQTKQGMRIACDVFPGRSASSKVRVVAKADAEGAKALSAADRAALEEVLSRRLVECIETPPPTPVRLELELIPNRAAKLAAFSLPDAEPRNCVDAVVSSIHLGGKAAGRFAFGLSFETPAAPKQ